MISTTEGQGREHVADFHTGGSLMDLGTHGDTWGLQNEHGSYLSRTL